MQMRLANAADIPEIAALFFSCVNRSYVEVLSEEVRASVNLEFSLQLWTDALGKNPERETYLAFDNEDLVGFFRIGPEIEDPSVGHLYSLYVSPDFSGRGYGSQLLDQAMRALQSSGYETISLWVFDENQVAKALYRKFGFEASQISRTTEQWRALEVKMVREPADSVAN